VPSTSAVDLASPENPKLGLSKVELSSCPFTDFDRLPRRYAPTMRMTTKAARPTKSPIPSDPIPFSAMNAAKLTPSALGLCVGDDVVGDVVGLEVGLEMVGETEGLVVGESVGRGEGILVGKTVGLCEGMSGHPASQLPSQTSQPLSHEETPESHDESQEVAVDVHDLDVGELEHPASQPLSHEETPESHESSQEVVQVRRDRCTTSAVNESMASCVSHSASSPPNPIVKCTDASSVVSA